ncbi:hypothetical protein AC249_AIPGENE18011 [Exaiptasia diaphana]|nr:hypothetical protein AC249_AIPGENE18011 [Exaiptasia diaphana]
MKLSLTLLVIFGFVAFIGAAPVEDEPEAPELSESDAPVKDDAPEEEQAQDEDDISDDDDSNEDDDEDATLPNSNATHSSAV